MVRFINIAAASRTIVRRNAHMTGNNKTNSALTASNEPLQANGDINQMLEQLHADFDPVYSMLMNYQCAVMEVETKFNVLNNRLSLQD